MNIQELINKINIPKTLLFVITGLLCLYLIYITFIYFMITGAKDLISDFFGIWKIIGAFVVGWLVCNNLKNI